MLRSQHKRKGGSSKMRGKKFGALLLAAALTVASVRCFGLSAAAEEELREKYINC